MADAHKNFAYSTVVGTNQGDTTAPGTGTTLTVQAGDGAKFPPVPFNATVWATGVQPLTTNAEIVRVTDIDGDTFTISRQQESSSSRSVVAGDQIAAAITAQTLTDAEAPLTYWASPHVAGTAQTGWQTLAANITSVTGTGSLFVFPVTVPPNLQFNQVLLGNSLSGATAAVSSTNRHTYYSHYGIYSMNANTALSLISSSSFSIVEIHSSRNFSWTYPGATATSGYGATSSFSGSTTAQQVSSIYGSRIIGLQFGGNMTLTGGQYYMGLLTLRSNADTNSTWGLSHAGIQGQPVLSLNAASGSLVPLGSAASAWSATTWQSHQSAWWGRHILGIMTATSITNFGGTKIPASIALSAIGTTGGAGSTATILPTVTFVST